MACDCETCDATTDDVRAFAYRDAEIVAMTDDEIGIYLKTAAKLFASSALGDCTCQLQALAAAAFAWADINDAGGVIAGPLASEADGPASRSFANLFASVTSSESPWLTTPYGKRIVQLIRTCSPPAAIVANTNIRQGW